MRDDYDDAVALTLKETRCIIKAWKSGVKTPAVYFVDPKVGLLIMEYIRGKTAKETIINDEIPIGTTRP